MKEADFYAVQCYCDGFGNDTCTLAIFPTENEAQNWCDKYNKTCKPTAGWGEAIIVPQKYGEYFNYWC